MKTIGIDTNNYLVYEGNSMWGHAIWPTPELIPATIVDESENDLVPKNNNDLLRLPFLFIDDGYDPTSRIRKGRIYEKYESQPNEWWVQPHPATPGDIKHKNKDGVLNKSLATFREFNFQPALKQLGISNPLIVLGSNTQFTIWSVIDVETSISGETILFLKARKTIGALPKVDYSSIDREYHKQIREKLNILSDDIHQAGPESIVDCCREAATTILSAYMQMQGHKSDGDLGDLIEEMRKQKPELRVVNNLADVIARYHTRRKHVVQEKFDPRRINEQDAELAIQSVGIILCDLKWANWEVQGAT
jgi:hypothetical protein